MRPNSLANSTIVESSSPRCFRSLSKPAIGLSTALKFRSWLAFRPLWASQTPAPPAPCWTWMKRTPRSTKPARGQHLHAEVARRRVVEAVQLLRRLRLVVEVERLGHRRLHAEGELVGLDPRVQGRVVRVLDRLELVQPADEVEADLLLLGADVAARACRSRADCSGSTRIGTASCAGPR